MCVRRCLLCFVFCVCALKVFNLWHHAYSCLCCVKEQSKGGGIVMKYIVYDLLVHRSSCL